MGRPREFDETSVLDAAAAAFRRRGYAATSIDHLVEATGVHRGSLYGAFGSKHGLFLRVLEAMAAASTDPTERLDIVLIALLELAPDDPRVRQGAAALLDETGVTEEQLGRRLLARAGLPNERRSE